MPQGTSVLSFTVALVSFVVIRKTIPHTALLVN
jgi:hypothetical protein